MKLEDDIGIYKSSGLEDDLGIFQEQPEGRTIKGTIKDIGVSLGKGLVGVSESALGLTGLASDYISKILNLHPEMTEYPKDRMTTQESQQELYEKYSEPQKKAFEEVEKGKGFVERGKRMITHPSTIGHAAIESAPAMFAGGGVGGGLVKMGVAPLVSGAIGEGLVSAGQAAHQIREEMPEKELTAKQKGAVVASGALTSLISVIGGRMAKKLGIADPDTLYAKIASRWHGGANPDTVKRNILVRMSAGGLTEGFLEEMPQSVQEQFWLNAATGRPLTEGLGEAGAEGALVGFGMGAVHNIFSGKDTADQGEGGKEPTIDREKILTGLVNNDLTIKDLADLKEGMPPEDIAEIDAAIQAFEQGRPNAPEIKTEPIQEIEPVKELFPKQTPEEQAQIEKDIMEQREGKTIERMNALASLWGTLSETEKKTAAKLIVPSDEETAIEAERKTKEQKRDFTKTDEIRKIEQERKAKEKMRYGKEEKPQEPELVETGRWEEPDAVEIRKETKPGTQRAGQEELVRGKEKTVQIRDTEKDRLETERGEIGELTFEEFEKKYKEAFKEGNKYSPREAGFSIWSDKMADLYDYNPKWADAIENRPESKGPFKAGSQELQDELNYRNIRNSALRKEAIKKKEQGEPQKAEKRKPEKHMGEVAEEVSSEKATQIADEFNKKHPGNNLKFDGIQDRSAINKPPLYQFTPQEGPLQGRTFSVENPDSVEAVKGKLDALDDLSKIDTGTPKDDDSSDKEPRKGKKGSGKLAVNEFGEAGGRGEITIGTSVRYKRGKYNVEEIENGRAIISNARGEKVVNLSELSVWSKRLPRQAPTEKRAIGKAWIDNQQRPIIDAYEFKRGRNKGNYRVTLPDGSKKIVERDGVKFEEQKPSKQIKSITKTLKNETGSSEIANDIYRKAADLIQEGVDNFGRFRREMQKAFKNVWDKIKKHMHKLWEILKDQKGQVDVWHGSPHRFKRFTTEKIGTGEGAQAFGWGLYFTDQKGIADKYASELSDRPDNQIYYRGKRLKFSDSGSSFSRGLVILNDTLFPSKETWGINALIKSKNNKNEAVKILKSSLIDESGEDRYGFNDEIKYSIENIDDIQKRLKYKSPTVYKTTLHKGKDPSEYSWLDWEIPLDQQSEKTKQSIEPIVKKFEKFMSDTQHPVDRSIANGQDLYNWMRGQGNGRFGSGKMGASLKLLSDGIDGIRYPAGTLSGGGKGTNYVVFDENAVTIEKITDLLGNELGSSELINDIAYKASELINSGVNNIKEFTSKMQDAFPKIWDKIKKHIKALWDIVSNQRGEIAIGEKPTEGMTKERRAEFLKRYAKAPQIKETTERGTPKGRLHAIESLERPFNDFMYWIVDKNRPFSTVQRKLDKVTDNIDVFLKETQRPKVTAAKIKSVWDEDIKPMLETMAQKNITIPELEEYAHSKHAKEANKSLRRSNAKMYLNDLLELVSKKQSLEFRNKIQNYKKPEQFYNALNEAFKLFKDNERVQALKNTWDKFSKKPSGMTDAESVEILKKYSGDKNIESIRLMLADINKQRLEILHDAGLIEESEYQAIKKKYEYYVPLYREGYDDQLFGPSRGLKPSGRPIKVRGGSTRNVVNIVANSISNLERAINLSEKAVSTKALRDLVQENPNPLFWRLKKIKKSPYYDSNGNLRMYPDLFNQGANEFRFMADGKQYILEVNKDDKDAMLMLRTLKAEDGPQRWGLNTLARMNRWLARVNTSLSPEFIISNFIRDLQTAGINIKDTGVKGKSMMRGAIKAGRAIYAVERGKSTDKPLEQLYERFKQAGGKINWSDVHSSVEKLSKKLTREIEMLEGKRPIRKTVKEWADLIESINTSVENGVRLHAFKLATEQGFTDERAAQIASDLTVDFTKKGAAGPVINSLYLFANAGIQGSYRIMRASIKSRAVQKSMVGIFAAGFGTGLLNAMAGKDDDDEDYFNKIDDFVRERNAIFMIPGTKGKYVKIPLPWGYNFIWNFGTETSRIFTKENYSLSKGAGRLASVFINAFNPVASGTLLQTLSPTVSDPFVQVAENKNWFGGKLMPEQNQFANVKKPDSQRFWKSARTPSKWIAYELNKLTDGDKIKSGALDVSPETIDLIVDTVGGSALRFFTDTAELPIKMVKKEKILWHKYPFIRRVAGEQSEWSDSRAYHENITEVLTSKERLEAYRGTPEYRQLYQDTETHRKIFGLAKITEDSLRKLRKRRKKAVAANNKKTVEAIDKLMKNKYKYFNKMYNQAMKEN